MLASPSELTEELAGLEFVHARELEGEVREGTYHMSRRTPSCRPPPDTLPFDW